MLKRRWFAAFCWLVAAPVGAGEIVVGLDRVTPEGTGESIGTVTLETSRWGTLLTPDLTGLSPGQHGFHLHAGPGCGPAERDGNVVPGLEAKGHHDPEGTGAHRGPYGDGHLGDLPPLWADAKGAARQPVLAPRPDLDDFRGRTLVIHAGGDNFSDEPDKLGGGGARVACGVVPK